jgi:hypothetical protein
LIVDNADKLVLNTDTDGWGGGGRRVGMMKNENNVQTTNYT